MTQQEPQPALRPDNGPSERTDVTRLHAPIMREMLDPKDGYEPVPLWLVAVFGALVFWGGWYVATYSGGFRGDVLDEHPEARYGTAAPTPTAPPDPLVVGKRLFTANCVACHQASGTGQPGVYPPLAGSEWVLGLPARPLRILLHGLSGPVSVKGQTYNGEMPSFGGKLKDDQIAALLSYVRQEWGNGAAPVSPAAVAATRSATAGRTQPWTQSELLAVAVNDLNETPAPTTAPAPVK